MADGLNLIQRAAERLKSAAPRKDNIPPGVPPTTEMPINPSDIHVPATLDRGAQRMGQGTSHDYSGHDFVMPGTGREAEQRRSQKYELAKIPLSFTELRRAGMVTPDNMTSNISNEFRRVKRDLLLRARDPNSHKLVNNLIMVTSSVPGEGKTFTSTNLALSLAAERDLHVLLIDADPIRHSLSSFFDGQVRRGLIDVLAGEVEDVSDVMFRCEDLPTLSMIFAGGLRPNAPELMASRRMTDLCLELSTRYPDRMIIIDTPPVLSSAEPAMIALQVHQAIMVVAADKTSRAMVRKAVEGISACRNIGLLLNKAPHWHRLGSGTYYDYYQKVNSSHIG